MENRTEGPGTQGAPADWEALARYLAGESPAGEAEAVRAWLAEDPARGELLGALDRALDRAAAAPPAGLDVEAALRRVHDRMDEPAVLPLTARPAARPRASAGWGWGSPLLRAAALAALLLGGAYFLWRAVGGADRAAVYATEVGERDSLRLPDGTGVLLGPGSRLTVAAGYGRETREVELTGEALFDVPHDEARPFTVRAGGAAIRDVGTAFSVHSGGGDEVRVVVTSGAVVLHPAGTPVESGVLLRQGDRGVMGAEGRVAAERAADTGGDLAWTQGRLVFRDAPLAEVAADLRRWYGVELRAEGAAFAARRLTTSFQGEPPARVLEVVALALGAEVEMRGDTAVLRAPPAGTPR